MSLGAIDVAVSYSGAPRPAVDGVSLTLDSRELVVIAGPNGSGKSSLLRILGNTLVPSRGTVTLDDRIAGVWPRRQWAQRVGFLPQREEPAFAMTVAESVLLGRWAQLGPVASPGATDMRAIDRALERCGLSALRQRGIDTLSGGEWQRVRLARALAAEPAYLLLDEPSTSLDLAHEMGLYELLRELVGSGLGVLSVTHHVNVASRYADRMVLLDQGRIAAEGAVASVLSAATISAVYRWPVAIQPWRDNGPQVIPLRRDET